MWVSLCRSRDMGNFLIQGHRIIIIGEIYWPDFAWERTLSYLCGFFTRFLLYDNYMVSAGTKAVLQEFLFDKGYISKGFGYPALVSQGVVVFVLDKRKVCK